MNEPFELLLRREYDTGTMTGGVLYVDGRLQCYTLEDSCKLGFGKGCCIPPGRYKVTWTRSPKFGKETLRLHDVPERDGILIHAGNTAADVTGCIAVGKERRSREEVMVSQAALLRLERTVIKELVSERDVYITIEPALVKDWF